MYITYSSLLCNLIQVFQLFQSSFFQKKRANHCVGYVNFHDIEHQLQENICENELDYYHEKENQ